MTVTVQMEVTHKTKPTFLLHNMAMRFGHTVVPFAHAIPAFEFLLERAALNTEAFGRQGAIASGQPYLGITAQSAGANGC